MNPLLTVFWDVSPEIFSIGNFSVRWYGLSWALSFFLGYLLFRYFFKKENIDIALLDLLTTYMIIGTVVGARLGHCFFYEPQRFIENPLTVLKIWEGGMASHGAGIGILSSLALFSYIKKINYWWLTDRIAIVVAFSGFLIRLGNLMNSEIIGSPTNVPWAFIFPNAIGFDLVARHPSQLYEALWCLLIFITFLFLYIRKREKINNGTFFGIFMSAIFGFRFFIEFIKEKQVGFESDMLLNMGQILSIPFFIIGIIIIIFAKKRQSKSASKINIE